MHFPSAVSMPISNSLYKAVAQHLEHAHRASRRKSFDTHGIAAEQGRLTPYRAKRGKVLRYVVEQCADQSCQSVV